MRQIFDQCYVCINECKNPPTIYDPNIGYTKNNLCPKGTLGYKKLKHMDATAFCRLAFTYIGK